MSNRCAQALVLLALAGCTKGPPRDPSGDRVSYVGQVRPILAEHCASCHGSDAAARQAEVRVDTRKGLFAERTGDRAPAVVPGDPSGSPLYQRISAPDGRVMPPASARKPLTADQIDIVRRWIAQGADFTDHWAYTPPTRPVVPALDGDPWVHNPIDAFVLSALREHGLEPAPEADRGMLIRRLSLDATGLPPSPEEVDAFVADPAPDAYERLVERKLADPGFGEHRARYWLDVARYGDTHGFHLDNFRSVWPYRDWVVAAYNDDMPFDRFTVEQLAGDLVPGSTPRQRVATGFLRGAMSTSEGGTIEAEYAALAAKDRVEVLAAGWLGVTAGCAACHDHKFDPVTQREFYALTAFFRNTSQPVFDLHGPVTPPSALDPVSGVESMVTDELPGAPRAWVLERAQYDHPREEVGASVPAVLGPMPPGVPMNRYGLARWLVSDTHPLAARVNVNRFWAQLFGAGLVATASDFGVKGALPSNGPLLDWLAVELRESAWSVKHVFKLMLTSATYRQSSRCSAAALEKDPDHTLYACGPRFRMDAEVLRDLALASSGLLVRRIGGAPVKPYQPPGVWEAVSIDESDTRVYEQDHGEALYRRSLYTFWKRGAPPPAIELFDAPNRTVTVSQRERTETPLQALVGLDDPQRVEAARALGLIAAKLPVGDRERCDAIALRVLARRFEPAESQALLQTLGQLRAHYAASPRLANALLTVGESPHDASLPADEQAAWAMVASIVLNLDEAVQK